MKRRATLLLVMMATALVVASGTALAAISCTADTTCLGTNDNEEITGTTGDDTIKAGAGNDAVMARGGQDKVFGQGGIDGPLDGGAGNDTLNGGPNDNTALEWLIGGRGNDTLVESPGVDRYIFGPGWGQDIITGNGDQPDAQADSDNLCFDCGTTTVTASVTVNLAKGRANDGTNTITWDPTVTFIEGAYSGSGGDRIIGSARSDVASSGWGADTINVSGGDSDVINCGGDPDVDTVTMDSGDWIVPGSCEGDAITTVP